MSETAEGKVGKWAKLERILKRWEYWIGVAGLALTVGVVVAVILYFDDIQALGTYGYLGAFLVGVFGGATYIASVPMTPVIFVLGTVLKPSFAPYLGPVLVGVAAGLGETIGGVAIYMTGYGGGTAIIDRRYGRLQSTYERLMRWMERRGSLVLFILSAVLNPFFYPVALAAGASRFSIQKYLVVCWVGKTIKGISVAAAGYWGLGSLLRMFGVPI